MHKGIKILIGTGIIILSIVAIYLIFMTITDYKPKDVISLEIENNKDKILQKNKEISAITFNIGYCGLDKDQDFFMDGGKSSRSRSVEQTITNLTMNTEFIKEDSADFVLLQEVDVKSTRSFGVDQYQHITKKLEDYSGTFAINYKVPWVPVPLNKPHGNVKSGIALLSKYNVSKSTRYKFPGEVQWPRKLALLDRCMIASRLPVEGGKELIVLNIHLSAYDKGGMIRKQQLDILKQYIMKEYNGGNYVVVGGDFNHVLPGTDMDYFKNTREWPSWLQNMPEDFKPDDFEFYVDKEISTNRAVDTEYIKGENYVSIIDGFLVSNNIEVTNVNGYDLAFKNSDHQPVRINFKLK